MGEYLEDFDLNHECKIIRVSHGTDSYCNKTTVETTIVSNEPCAVWQSAGNEVVIGDRVHNPINYVMAIKPSTGYAATDKVIVNGSTFTVGNPHNVANEDDIMIFNLESVE